MVSITNHWENANKNHIEISLLFFIIFNMISHQEKQKINNICNIYIYNSDIYIYNLDIYIYIYFDQGQTGK